MSEFEKDNSKNKEEAAHTASSEKSKNKSNSKDNSAHNQRLKLLDWLFEKNSITTAQARESLDIMSPAARIMELRKAGYQIVTFWDSWTSEHGIKHRIGRYVLVQKQPVTAV